MKILSLSDSNQFIINLLREKKPFLITRVGMGAETHITYVYKKKKRLALRWIRTLSNNAGIYNTIPDYDNILKYCRMYADAIKNSTALAVFQISTEEQKKYNNSVMEEQRFFMEKYALKSITVNILDPNNYCLENIKTWTNYLLGKKVLVINPFVASMQKQLSSGFQMFRGKKKNIFKKNQEFIFYKSFQTSAGNYIHKNWLETYNIMCEDINKLDFDIALLGCGGYGLPLCNYIYSDLKKSAIYIGGAIQLLFGVMGARWENSDYWKKIIKENNTKFIRPSKEEQMKNQTAVEGGCYW